LKEKFGSLGCVIVKHKNTMKKLSHTCRQRSKVFALSINRFWFDYHEEV